MRRVVVTGMGIVSSIGNNTQEVLASLREAKSGIARADEYATLGFRCQVHGAPTLDPAESVDRRAMRFLGRGAAWNHVAMEQAIRDAGVEENDISNERTGIIMGSGGPSTRTIVEAAAHRARRKGRSASARSRCRRRCRPPPRRRSPPGSRSRASTIRSRRPAPRPTIASATRWRRSSGASRTWCSPAAARISTGPVGAVRRDGRDVVRLQPDAGQGLARLRQGPRRLRDRRRRRRPGARRAGARQGARRENLRRNRRLRRDLRRPRHGGAVGRRRGALHEDGAGERARRRSTTSIRTPPRRRSATSRRSRRSARCSATSARRSRRPSRSPAIRSAPPARRRRSIRC